MIVGRSPGPRREHRRNGRHDGRHHPLRRRPHRPRRGPATAHGARHLRRRRRAARHAPRLLRAQPVRPGARSSASMRRPRSHSTASMPCSRRPTSIPASTKRGSPSPARTSPTAPAAARRGRGPLRRRSVALVIAEDRYIAEDAADLVDVEYEPLTAVVDYATADSNEELVFEGWAGNVCGGLSGRPAETLAPVFDEAALVVEETIHQQAYAASPMETRGHRRRVVARRPASSRCGPRSQSPHDLRMFAARLLGRAREPHPGDRPRHRRRRSARRSTRTARTSACCSPRARCRPRSSRSRTVVRT